MERAAKSVRRYIRECFSHAYYWKIYLFNVCFICGLAPLGTFLVLYATDTLKIGLARYGTAMAIRDGARLLVFLAMGPLVDRPEPCAAATAR